MSETSRPRRTRRLLPALVAAGLVLIVAVVVLDRAGSADAEHSDLAQAWSADLDTWATDTSERLGAEAAPAAHGHDLATLFDADLTQPVRPGDPRDRTAGPDDVDTINAACTALTSYIDTARDVVQPPAAPAGLDTDHPDAAEPAGRFADYQQALTDAQQRTGSVESATRTFCGTYPALVAAHAEAAEARTELEAALECDDGGCALAPGADVPAALVEEAVVVPNERISASLRTQCYLTELAPVCAADATEAADLAQVWGTWSENPDDDAAHLAQAGTVAEGAREVFSRAAADLGGDRAGVLQVAHDELDGIAAALTGSAEDLATALTEG